jgi:segregation and condensation protein A
MDEPFGILLELVMEGKLDPWEVDIGRLIDPWLAQLNRMDLRTCGRGILSASTLLRIKSGDFDGNGNGSLLLEEEEIPELPDLGPIEVVRFAARKIQLKELLAALREALSEAEIRTLPSRRRPQPKVEELPLSDFEGRIEVLMQAVYKKLLELGGRSTFSSLLDERTKRAAIRLFVLLLCLASDGKVVLTQEGQELKVEVRRDGDRGGLQAP